MVRIPVAAALAGLLALACATATVEEQDFAGGPLPRH